MARAKMAGLALSLSLLACAIPALAASPVLVIHGGAGVEKSGLSADEQAAARAAMAQALRAGHAVLAQGGSAVDAVAATITVLEDAPQFNAGRGAVFTHDGRNELDAAIMDGATGQAGAIAGVHRVRNPIQLMREVNPRKHMMEEMGAAFMAHGLVTLAGSRLYTSAADTDEIVDEALNRFEDVFKMVIRACTTN